MATSSLLSKIDCNLLEQESASIPVRITLRRQNPTRVRLSTDNLIKIKTNKSGPPPPKITPMCMVINARSLAKPHATPTLNIELRNWKIDICFISETWLNTNIASSLVCPSGYVLLRKDRIDGRQGGGVAILCREDWNCSFLNFESNTLECFWSEINTPNTKFYVASLYHPPDPTYPEIELLSYLSDTIERILLSDPNAKLIIAGDINQMPIRDLMSQHNLDQLVKKPTRGQKVLDVFLTNCPYLFKQPKVFKCLMRSDHLAVLITPQVAVKPQRRNVYFRDVREHRKIEMQRKLMCYDWSDVYTCNDVDEATLLVNNAITGMYNHCFPLIKVKVSTRDPPYMSPLVKHLCNMRNKNINMGMNVDLQKHINMLIRENLVRAVKNERKEKFGSKKWWDTVNKITGRKVNNNNIDSIIDPQDINLYFQKINTDDNYSAPEYISIPDGTRIPIVDVSTVQRYLQTLKRTSPGPDSLPYWLWKEYAQYLAPVVTKLFNLSLECQYVPFLWKHANINPLPKESPVAECNQLRPISLTNIIMRLFERIVFKQEISLELKSVIGEDQFAYKEGTNTTDALIMCQHNWLKWLDEEADHVRVISFDFKKAFDSVPHDILCEKLKAININPYIINWILSFLSNRRQRVVVNGTETNYVDINKGIPQGTVLGPFLFSIMVNDIMVKDPRNNLLIKFADDLTISAPVKLNCDSAAAEVKSIEDWSRVNRMSLNLSKTWEMIVSGKTTKPPPPPIAGLERKTWLKLLGLLCQDEPCCWDMHVDNLLAKASSRMYILRICRYYGYPLEQLAKLFDSLIMSLFLYGIEVWGSVLGVKNLDRIDKFFKRAHKFGYTTEIIKISSVIKERDKCLFDKIRNNPSHILYGLLPDKKQRTLRKREHEFILPNIKTERFKRTILNRCLFNYFS